MGTIINNHPEYPLHFLQGKRSPDKNFNFLIFLGIWGSAFSILIHRGKDLNYFQTHFNSRISECLGRPNYDPVDNPLLIYGLYLMVLLESKQKL